MISIIIPVYKVEDYLHECVDSVLSQSYHDIEVILVDDGSPDGCPQICDEYAANDTRITVIHKKNGGLSEARNTGMSVAKGEYIYCIDSDDYLDDPDLFDKVLQIFREKGPDIVAFYYKRLIKGRVLGYDYTDYSGCYGLTAEDTIYNSVKADKLYISACQMFVRRDFILENALFFKKGIKSEDIERGFRLYAKRPKVAYYSGNPYIYRLRDGSITTTIDYPHLLTYLQIVSDGIQIAESCEEILKQALLGYAVYHVSIIMGLMGRVKTDEEQTRNIDAVLKPICKRYMMKYALGKKVKLVALVYSFLRYRGTKKLLGMYLNGREV